MPFYTMASTVRCVTFDLDDTLFASRPVLLRASELCKAWLTSQHPQLASVDLGASMSALRADRPEIAHDYTELRRLAIETACAAARPVIAQPAQVAEKAIAEFLRARSDVALLARQSAPCSLLASRS